MELKSIYLLHHSHLDIGFTHSQVVIEQLQTDFLDQALDLLEETEAWDDDSKPRWTIEAHDQFRLWLASATPEKIARLKAQVDSGRLGLGAIQYNTSPLSSLESLFRLLSDIQGYRAEFGFPVKAAFQHDVNGLPWVMSDLLLDAGVELFVMAINLHTGGNGPVRPGLFRWKTPSGRTLRVMSGHDYAAFDGFTKPWINPVDKMKEGIDAQWALLQELGYPYDFLYLSSTNLPVAYDNGGPSLLTAKKVREWNRQEGYPRIQYVTPEQLADKLSRIPDSRIPEFEGDWNDFWNYGAGSSARETAVNAATRQKLFASGLLGTRLPDDARLDGLQKDAWNRVLAFEEHTWGYWAHAVNADHPQVVTTEIYKRGTAHDGHEMARYVLSSRLSNYAANPAMSVSGGILAVNPSPVRRTFCFDIPPSWKSEIFGRLEGFNYANSEPLVPPDCGRSWPNIDGKDMVLLEIEPFSSVRLPWSECQSPEEADSLGEGSRESLSEVMVLDGHSLETRTSGTRFLETAFHFLEYDPKNGRIIRLLDRQTHWDVIPEDAEYNLFEPVHEKPDPRFDASRKSYYDRDVEKELKFQACWNPDWKAARCGISEVLDVRIEKGPRSVSLIREYRMEGVSRVIQRFELCADRPWIEVSIILHKDRIATPESVYFASQLNLAEGWNAVYDGSGVPIRLDDEQLPGSGRNWLTVEAFTRMEDERHQFSVFAPDMPLVQIGDFHWGHPKAEIPRRQYPLLVNWACNNYWETNFPTTQEGVIRYRCGIYTSSGARNSDIYRMADGFARQPLLLPLASCLKAESEPLATVNHPDVRLVSIDRAVNQDGWIFRLVNTGDTPVSCGLDLHRPLHSGVLVSPVEGMVGECGQDGTVLRFDALPRQVVSVLATF